MKKILFFFLLAVCSMSISAQGPSKKCPTCGLSIPKCQYKGKHPKTPQQTKPVKQSSAPQKSKAKPTTGTINGHEWVDLGLSVKWATMNVGAISTSDYGSYYAWGETTPKAFYSEENSRTYNKSLGDISGNLQYDAARANWGSPWRLPTKNEFQELLEKCEWQWTTQGGHSGYYVTSKINNNSLFFPAAGSYIDESLCLDRAEGVYWSSTPSDDSTFASWFAYYLTFNYSSSLVFDNRRSTGRSVRPVTN